jgi:O-antigen ligase
MTGVRLPRLDLRPVAWAVGALVLSAGAGLLVGASADAALDVAIVAAAAIVIAARPYPVLIGVVLILAVMPQREWIPFFLLAGATVALAARAPALPGKRVSVPLLLLLVFALPSVPRLPGAGEGIITDPYLRLPVVGLEYARTPSFELREWLSLGAVLALFCLAAWCVRGRRRLDTLVRGVLLSSVVPIGVGLGQLVTGNTYERIGTSLRSVRGTFPHPNYFAFYLVVVLAVAIAVLLDSRSLSARLGLGTLIGAGTVCLFLTYTRSAWIGFALTLLGMGALRYRRLLVVALVGLVVAALAAPGAVHEAQQRFGDLTSKSQASDSSSWTWRLDQWSAILPYGFERPLTGQGWDSYPRLTVRKFGHSNRRFPTVRYPAYGVYSPIGFTAHNDYVKNFVELGVPGLALWLLTLVGLVGTAWRARRVPGVGGIASTIAAAAVALMLISASDNLQGYTAVLSYLFVLCGALAGVTAAARRGRVAAGAEPVAPIARDEPGVVSARPAEPWTEDEPTPAHALAPASVVERARSQLRRLLGRRR